MPRKPPKGNLAIFEFNYLVGTPEKVEHFTEEHITGLFTRNEMMSAFQEAGLKVTYEEKGIFNRGLYIGEKK